MSKNTLLFSAVGVAVFLIALLFCHVSDWTPLFVLYTTSENKEIR